MPRRLGFLTPPEIKQERRALKAGRVFPEISQSPSKPSRPSGGGSVMPSHPDIGAADRAFPTSAGILFGLGLGGFFDGIVLHEVLQWHHMMTSAGYPPDSVDNLKINTLWDGLFHSATYIFVLLGLIVLWRAARRRHRRWSSNLLIGTTLMGFGIFNLVEGVVNHHLLGIHHVNETVSREQWVYWDIGFLLWGAAMLIGGWAVYSAEQRQSRREQQAQG